MAGLIKHTEVTVTREDIYNWVQEAREKKRNIREYVREQLEADVLIAGSDVEIGDEVKPVVAHILEDLDSYL